MDNLINIMQCKARRLNIDEWIVGYLTYDSTDELWKIYCNIYSSAEPYALVEIAPIDESTICRSTGAKDKNGYLIFTKDIVKKGLQYYYVDWDPDQLSFELYTLDTNTKVSGFNKDTAENFLEVTGNIIKGRRFG